MAASAKFLKEATDFDSENKLFEAFVKYLEATASLCLDIAEKCKLGNENAFSEYANQRLKLINHCHERATSVHELLLPKQPASTSPIPNETHIVKPRNDVLHQTNPEEVAKEINRQLILRHRESIKTKQYSEAELASKEIALQKKMLENLSLAEQKKRKSMQPPSSPSTGHRTLGRNFSNAKNEIAAGFQNTLRRSTNQDSTNTLRRRSLPPEPHINYIPSSIETDSDMEAGPMLPKLDTVYDPRLVVELEPKEKSRQTAILELIHTEKTHVGHLKILWKVYYQPLKQHSILPENFVQFAPCSLFALIFPNFVDILDIHVQMNQKLKYLLRSKTPIPFIGDVLLKFFDRESGEKFSNAAVQFCHYQQYAIEQIEERKNQDIKFDYFLTDAQNHRLSRNFTLADWLLKEMQRLTKYPLLIEQIIKYTDENELEERQKLERCLQCTKALLEATNSAKRSFDSWRKLTELQLVLDTSKFDRVNHPVVFEFQKFDLRNYTFIHDGFLTWKQGRHKVANIHGVLLDEALVLLTKKGNKLFLKFHGATVTTDERDGSSKILRYCPIVVLNAVEVKDDPNEDSRFFIYERNSTVPPYELTARSNGEKVLWLKHVQEQINNKKGNPNVPHEPHSLVEQVGVVSPSKDSKLNDSGVTADIHESNIELKAKLTRKINRLDGLIYNTLLNKHKCLAEMLNLPLERLQALADTINSQIDDDRDLKTLTVGAILQVDTITAMITNTCTNENFDDSEPSFGNLSCTELSPVVNVLSQYLNLILVSVA